jgi:hypothetical protein
MLMLWNLKIEQIIMNKFNKKFHFIVLVSFAMLQFAYFDHAISLDHNHHDEKQNICQICINLESFTVDICDANLAIKSIFIINKNSNNYQDILLSYGNQSEIQIRAPPILS